MQENENKNNELLESQEGNQVAEFDTAENSENVQVSENKNAEIIGKNANSDENNLKNSENSEEMQELLENDADSGKQKSDKPKFIKTIEIITGSTIFKYVLGAMIIFAICFISSLFTFNIVLVPVEVQGYSMLPTINASASGLEGETYTDIVYISSARTLSYKDIVVIKGGKTQSGKQIIKRIIATPGDTLTFRVTRTDYSFDFKSYFVVDIYLNGKKLVENYTKESETKIQNTHNDPEYFSFGNKLVDTLESDGEFTIKMGTDEYFVMGDNRNAYNKAGDERSNGSVDSRMFGTVKKSEIVGKVAIQVKYGQNMLQAIWQAIFGVRLQIV